MHPAPSFRRHASLPRRIWLLAVLIVLLPLSEGHADERRYKLEAAFIYNFLNYITWPGYESPQDLKDATVCIIRGNPVEPYLAYVQRSRAQERRLTIRALEPGVSADGCHMVYVSGDRIEATPETIAALAAPGTLVVGSAPHLIASGGMIQLMQENERLSILIDQPRLTQAGYKVSSRLLEIARLVE